MRGRFPAAMSETWRLARAPEVYETTRSRGAFVEAGPDRALAVPAGGVAVLLDGLLGATPPFGFLVAGATPVDERPVVASRLFVWSSKVEGPPGTRRLFLLPTTELAGNAFRPLAETGRFAAALLKLAPGRSVTVGPESERTFVVLHGTGLAFFENGDTLAFKSGEVVVAPEGEPVRLWARDPDAIAVVALQPHAPPAERRTLAGELARLRQGEGRA